MGVAFVSGFMMETRLLLLKNLVKFPFQAV